MKPITFHQAFIRMFMLMTLCFVTFSFTTKVGLDSYEIYLNNKLILKQSVNQPLNLRVLQLKPENAGDQLHINYKHCTLPGAGTDRSITLEDEQGKILKKWAFPDATGADLSMVIAVKELLQLEKNNPQHDLSLRYAARELTKGQTLAFLRVK